MIYEDFSKIVSELQKQEQVIDELHKLNVGLIEFVDPYHSIITTLINEVYGEEGADWFFWFCYENNFGTKGLEAWDTDKNPICYSVKSLWEYIEALKAPSSN
jgi:hypothetical protein